MLPWRRSNTYAGRISPAGVHSINRVTPMCSWRLRMPSNSQPPNDRAGALRAALRAILSSTGTSDDMWKVPDLAKQALQRDDELLAEVPQDPPALDLERLKITPPLDRLKAV